MNKKLLVLSVAAFSSNAFSAAHLLPELGAVNASTAGAGSAALAESALTAWSNPAGMSQLEEANLTVNVATLGTKVEFSDAQRHIPARGFDSKIDAGSWMPVASMYFVSPINDKFHAGIALASQGGAGVDYGDSFTGGLLLESAEFMTVQVMPSVSYKVNEKLALGLSANIEYFTASGDLGLGTTTADADDFNVGYSLSAFYKFSDEHRVGAIYRSEISHYGTGSVTSQNMPGLNGGAGLDFIMPAHLQLSGVHSVANQWDVLWSATWYDLSTWTDLTLDLSSVGPVEVQRRDFDDVWNIALGTHYHLNEQWRLEAGISYETSPQDDPTKQYMDLPVGEAKRIGVGATYQLNDQWQIRGYYDYIDLGSPDIDYSLDQNGFLTVVKGSYENSAHFLGLQANFKFK